MSLKLHCGEIQTYTFAISGWFANSQMDCEIHTEAFLNHEWIVEGGTGKGCSQNTCVEVYKFKSSDSEAVWTKQMDMLNGLVHALVIELSSLAQNCVCVWMELDITWYVDEQNMT